MYASDVVNIGDGSLQLSMTHTQTHDLKFQWDMAQSWNKLCVQSGAAVKFSGRLVTRGLWPGFLMMGIA